MRVYLGFAMLLALTLAPGYGGVVELIAAEEAVCGTGREAIP